jgi:hypothetical protein
MNLIKNIFLLTTVTLTFTISNIKGSSNDPIQGVENFLGMWTINIEWGGVAWLNVYESNGYLDAELMWGGGSVLPVSHVYLLDENHLVVTKTQNVSKYNREGKERKHIITHTMDIIKKGNEIHGELIIPNESGIGVQRISFTGVLLPKMPMAPNLAKIKYGKPISLLNGENLDGWKIIGDNLANGFKMKKGILVNDPVQEEGNHVNYGNLRTIRTFEDFNLTLEVNVPEGNNSGVYLRGLYEIQVLDSYGKPLDSHHMGALYSRITPTIAAEKPPGQWQKLDITLCDRHITVILNDKKIIDNQPAYGPTGGAISTDVFAPGPIFLQGDHGNVSYRNIVLKPIIH